MSRLRALYAWWTNLRRRWQGLLIGCMLWLFWLIFGLWWSILLVVLAVIGFVIGRIFEEHQSWKDVLDKLLSERFGD